MGGGRRFQDSFREGLVASLVVDLLHGRFGMALILYMLVLGIWGVINYFRGSGISGSYLGALVIGEILAIVQTVLGVGLLLSDVHPGREIHFLYGALFPLIIPFVYTYARAQPARRASMLYGLATLFLFGLAIRAMGTGGQ
jgi:hypothetical protein